jgi:hypothetical protein
LGSILASVNACCCCCASIVFVGVAAVNTVTNVIVIEAKTAAFLSFLLLGKKHQK